MAGNRQAAIICLLLAALVFMVFGQTIRFGFVNLDDLAYVTENPVVSKGLSFAGIGWAFTHVVAGLWHPLTVMVLMLESQLFGSWPGGYHLVNVALHAACAVLLFILLLKMTGAPWRSGFVAAVFAIHPLRVESVAWVTECKDVLSGMFFMLTLLAYARYVRGPRSRGRYAMVLLWFALGLMSKSMVVTIPCVLLLLDYWPLGRLKSVRDFSALIWEKTPLFALAALSSLATVFAVKSGDHPPIETCPANAPIAYVVYLGKLIYPTRLTLPYPYPMNGWPPWQLGGALLILSTLSAGAWLLRRDQPYLLTGWLWYAGMLVPVAGVMQTDYYQAYADRFTYLPQIGLCIAGTWLAADWTVRRRYPRSIVGGVAGAILCALSVAGWRQTTYWRDSITLWTHALECTQDNSYAHYILGNALLRQGRTEQAAAQFCESLRIDPAQKQVRLDLATAMLRQGRMDEAIAQYREALKIDAASASIHYRLGRALLARGRLDDASVQLHQAVRIDPALSGGLNELANVLIQHGRMDDAVAQYREVLRIDPAAAVAHANLGNALAQQGKRREAIAELQKALQLQPANATIRDYLARALKSDKDM